MKKRANHILLLLQERNGEYEYLHRSVHEIPDGREGTAEKFSKNYAKNFYGGKANKEDGGYYFYGGEIHVRVNFWQFITEEDYCVFKKYL